MPDTALPRIRASARWVLGLLLILAGIAHFVEHDEFLGQVPPWIPAPSIVIWLSGIVEISLGSSLIAWRSRRREIGWVVAGFFVLVFPGNIYQAVAGTDAFGLDTPTARWVRLAFQPLLIIWALWCTGAWPSRERDHET